MPKKRIPSIDEMERVRATNAIISPIGFKAYFFSKEGLKGTVRPFRMSLAGRGDDCVRYFDTIEGLEKFSQKIFDEREAVEKLNVLLKMFDIDRQAKIVWSGNKCDYRLARVVAFGDRETTVMSSFRALEARVQMMIEDKQRSEALVGSL